MRPRYADLFAAMRDALHGGDVARYEAAFDAILAERGEALPDLAEFYWKSARDDRLRWDAVQLMGFSGDPRAIPLVVEALLDPAAAVRAEACRALEDLRARDAIPALLERAQDLDPTVREDACEALAAMGVDLEART